VWLDFKPMTGAQPSRLPVFRECKRGRLRSSPKIIAALIFKLRDYLFAGARACRLRPQTPENASLTFLVAFRSIVVSCGDPEALIETQTSLVACNQILIPERGTNILKHFSADDHTL
jgi:hypothetical protein